MSQTWRWCCPMQLLSSPSVVENARLGRVGKHVLKWVVIHLCNASLCNWCISIDGGYSWSWRWGSDYVDCFVHCAALNLLSPGLVATIPSSPGIPCWWWRGLCGANIFWTNIFCWVHFVGIGSALYRYDILLLVPSSPDQWSRVIQKLGHGQHFYHEMNRGNRSGFNSGARCLI